MAIFETSKYRFPYPDGAESLSNIALNFQALAERLETTYELLGISYPIVAGVALMQEGDPAGGDLTNYYPNPTITTSAVTTSKINDQAVTTAKIADLNVTTGKIANDAVTTAKLAVVGLKDGSTAVTQPQSDGSTKVATTAYVDAYVAGTVPDGSIGTSELADGAVTNAKVNASAAIAYSKLNLAGSIVNADVATGAAIAYSKLALSGAIQESDLAFSVATQSELDTVAGNAATALSNHESDTTSIHGISDTANLVYTNDSRLTDSRTPTGAAGGVLSGTYPNPGFAVDMATQTELDNHASATTSVHGIADTSVLATQTDVSTAVSTHSSDTTSVHGISDTANLVYTNDSRLSDSRTPTGGAGGVLSGSYPNPGFAVDMATQSELDNHASDTTSVHGIADTSVLATSTDVSTAVSTHAAVTTSVHGISNTANLVYTNDSRLTDARTPTSHAGTHVPGGSDVLDYTKIIGYGTSLPTWNATTHPAGVLWVVNTVGEPYSLYRSDGVSAWKQVGGGGASITVSDSAPSSPVAGAMWYKSSSGKTYIYYNDGNTSQWVEVGAASQLVIPQHGSSHVRGGADVIDGDRLTVDYVPTNYTRNSAANGAGDATDLTAHLSGLDNLAGQGHVVCTSSTRPSSPVNGMMIYETDTKKTVLYHGSWIVQNWAGQSAFRAYHTSNFNVCSSGTTTNAFFPQSYTESFDLNNDFNVSTGIFTAPVSGIYCFSILMHIMGMAVNTGFLYVNLAGIEAMVVSGTDDPNYNTTGQATMTLNLSAGATVAAPFAGTDTAQGGAYWRGGATYNYYCGHLVRPL